MFTAFQVEREPGAAMVAEQQLLDGCGVVEPRPAHEWILFHRSRRDRDIGIETYTEGIREVTPVDDASVHVDKLPGKCALNCLCRDVWEFECVPGEVIAGTGGDDTQGDAVA